MSTPEEKLEEMGFPLEVALGAPCEKGSRLDIGVGLGYVYTR